MISASGPSQHRDRTANSHKGIPAGITTPRERQHGVFVEAALEHPYRSPAEVIRRIQLFAGEVVLFLAEGCGSRATHFMRAMRGNAAPAVIEFEDPDLWPLELDEILDSLGIDAPAARVSSEDRAEEAEDEKTSWPAAAEEISALMVEEEKFFLITDRCLRRLAKSRYPFPYVMVTQTKRLRDFARCWSKGVIEGGMGGRLVEVAKKEYGLNISLYDRPMRRGSLDEFVFEGRTYSREPHVKVGDNTTPDRVGRIYFALDAKSVPARVIVDHIGLKLSPYVKR